MAVKKTTTNYQLPTTAAKPLVVIVGETASGKSSLAMELAMRFNGEIICADSWTVRREVNIGTAKPTLADCTCVRHHLLDIVDPCADFTAAVFKKLAIERIEDITARNRLPIMTGGTGLYIDSVLYDFTFLPPGEPGMRQQLNNLTTGELLKLIKERGLSTDEVDIRNKRRLIRLLETGGMRAKRGMMRPNSMMLGLRINRDVLNERVTQRVDAMLQNGLETEVKKLGDTYGWDCEALKGIGYSEWQEYFCGSSTIHEVRQKIITDTLNLAKRQRTWFKRNDDIHWLDDPKQAIEIVTTLLNKSG